jgi:hypothetical protein
MGSVQIQQKALVTCYTELMFLDPVGSMGHVVCSGAPGVRNIDALFFILGLGRRGYHKKHVGTRYVELVFFHGVGYTGHVVCSGASGAQNIDTIFFMLGVGPVRIP